MRIKILFLLFILSMNLQSTEIHGLVKSDEFLIGYANVKLIDTKLGAKSDNSGYFTIKNVPKGKYQIVISALGFDSFNQTIEVISDSVFFEFNLIEKIKSQKDIVITGTMKEVTKSDSPVPVEVYSSEFFKANPTPSVFESLQNINGVRPQLNCNICNTGDIHINGLEGPYSIVLIDGMPIVSGLSTVYGLTGIPQSLIDRIEIVKGPASTLYGSEAVGGLINLITKKPNGVPRFSVDVFSSNWRDMNFDIGSKFNLGEKTQVLFGVNYFNYQNPIDINNDNFTDITLQNRISFFNKINFERQNNRQFTIATRYVYEDRWGGEMNWNEDFRGGDSVYAESIYTNRWEVFGLYELPFEEKILFQFSANGHNQNSYYGVIPFFADQYIGFGQLTWFSEYKYHNILLGATFRYTWYDDNTVATNEINTNNEVQNKASIISLPGIFLQDEIVINENNKLLLGLRYDYNSIHGNVFTPRLNYKINFNDKNDIIRFSIGNGYRVANVFTEDHAALTGARQVVFANQLNPETSWNGNINYVKKIFTNNSTYIGLDASIFYTHFSNRIIADYLSDPNKIIYDNLDEAAVSKGFSLNLDISFANGLDFLGGLTIQDVSFSENGVYQRQLLTEQFSGVWGVSYNIKDWDLKIDYTGNIYGPMLLPLLGSLDDRQAESPIWSLQNIQFTKPFFGSYELYFGFKNILNFTPPANSIARAFDPFDKNVIFDNNGNVVPTQENPNALTFDPSYVFAPNQGRRFFMGIRYNFR